MKNKIIIKRAVEVHFAIADRKNMTCDVGLEDYSGVANDFLRYFLTGNMSSILEKKLESSRRYRVKKQLIERYIENHA